MKASLLLPAALATVLLSTPMLAQTTSVSNVKLPRVERATPVRPGISDTYRTAARRPDITGFETPAGNANGMLPLERKRLNSIFALGPGDSVGYTYYDFQTNSAMPDRILYWPGATGQEGIRATMIWMAATDQTEGTTTRGTYGAIQAIDQGNKWIPIDYANWQPIEKPFERTGFSSIGHLSTGEIVLSNHFTTGTATGNSNILLETSAGSGVFTIIPIPGAVNGLWPRIAIGANDAIHVIWTFQNTDANKFIIQYSRSTDKGATWSDPVDLNGQNSVTGVNTPECGGGDAYALAANGDHLVLWYGSRGTQVIQMRSEDNGETWPSDKAIIVYEPQYTHTNFEADPDSKLYPDPTFGDTAVGFRSDTAQAPGSSIDVMVGEDGTVHGVFPIFPVYLTRYYLTDEDTTAATQHGGLINRTDYYYTDAGLMYFEEKDGETFRTPLSQPGGMTGSEEFLDDRAYTGSLSRWPQLGMSADGKVYLAFGSGVSSDFITATSQLPNSVERNYLYSHIYAMYTENGRDWSTPVNLTPNQVDAQWPSLANLVEDKLYIAYQSDTYPGDWLTSSGTNPNTGAATGSGLHDQLRNSVEVMMIDKAQLGSITPASVQDRRDAASGTSATLTGIVPNPSSGLTRLTYSVSHTGEYTIKIVNTLGQEMATLLDKANRVAGDYTLGFDSASLPVGSYLIVMSGNGISSTQPISIVR